MAKTTVKRFFFLLLPSKFNPWVQISQTSFDCWTIWRCLELQNRAIVSFSRSYFSVSIPKTSAFSQKNFIETENRLEIEQNSGSNIIRLRSRFKELIRNVNVNIWIWILWFACEMILMIYKRYNSSIWSTVDSTGERWWSEVYFARYLQCARLNLLKK